MSYKQIEHPYRLRYEAFANLAEETSTVKTCDQLAKILTRKLKYIIDTTVSRWTYQQEDKIICLEIDFGRYNIAVFTPPFNDYPKCQLLHQEKKHNTFMLDQSEVQDHPVLKESVFNSDKLNRFLSKHISLGEGQSITICLSKQEASPYEDIDFQFIQLLGSYIGNKISALVTQENLFEKNKELLDLNEKLSIATKEAQEATRAKTNFLATMSHEIRTPLNGILGMAQVLQNAPLQEDYKQQIDTIVESGTSLLEIINDILDMTKVTSGKIELEIRPFSIQKTISDIIALLTVRAQENGLSLEAVYKNEIPQCVLGDPGRFRQIILNLCTNALKFTQEGGVSITIEALKEEGNSVTLKFDVQDTGIGIPESAIEKIFNAYQQADESITRRFGGTGLGLPIVKELVDIMGGEMTVQSTVGTGSSFSFSLTFPRAEHCETEEDAGLGKAVEPSIKPMVLLVVDDNKVNLMVARALLEKEGHVLYLAESGQEAEQLLEEKANEIDLVLMDVHMPEQDGIQTTKKIRQHPNKRIQNMPIYGLTADVFKERIQECRDAGMHTVLEKPIQIMAIRDAFRRFQSEGVE